MKKVDIISNIVARKGEALATPSKDISKVNLSGYLLKSIWDKVFEIRTDRQGTEYIFGKLPVVTQYGITMYSDDGVDIPSLASGLPFDGRTIWYNPDTQQIEVIGGTGGGSGGGLDITALQNYLTSNSYLNVTSGDNRYLKLSGGTITGPLEIKCGADNKIVINNTDGEGYSRIVFQENGSYIGQLLSTKDGNIHWGESNIWHSGNDGSGSGLDADLLDGQHGEWYRDNVTAFARTNYTSTQTHDANVCITGMMYNYGSPSYWKNTPDMSYGQILTLRSYGSNDLMGQLAWDIRYGESDTTRYLWWRGIQNENRISSAKWHQIAFTDSNVASASKLLNGVGNVDGHLYMYNKTAIFMNDTTGTPRKVMSINGENLLLIGEQPTNYTTVIDGVSIHLRAKDYAYGLYVNSLGSVGIGTTAPEQKLHIVGNVWASQDIGAGAKIHAFGNLIVNGNAGLGTESPSYKLHIIGNAYVRDGISMARSSDNSNAFFIGKEDSSSQNLQIVNSSGSGKIIFRTNKNSSLVDHFILQQSSTILYDNLTLATTLNQCLKINCSHSADWVSAILAVNGALKSRQHYTINIGYENSQYNSAWIGYYHGGVGSTSNRLSMGLHSVDDVVNILASGHVGIGTTSPSAKLHVYNNASSSTGIILDGGWSEYGFLYNGFSIYLNGEPWGGLGVNTVTSAYGSTSTAGVYITNAKSGEYMNFYNEGGVFLKSNLLVNGGITMYSDQRKKTILNHVELSLKQIAEAPLIEHYYNSDEKKTTHVGSIAQYWASMNDWFCKLDSEGFYTMEIQNAALASAISIARELDRYETKTDKAIKKLKKRISELEDEVERLKSA